MDLEKPPVRPPHPEGCLTVAIRVPVRIVVLVLVVPVRMAWDALTAAGRLLSRTVLRPLGRALRWLGRTLFVLPFVALWRWVVVPAGKALGWLGHVLVVVPARWLYRYVLTPLGHGLARAARAIGAALGWLYARVLAPVGRGIARLLKGAGLLLAAAGAGVFAALAWLGRYLLVVPARWLYAWVLAPVGRALAWLVSALVTGVGAVLYWTARLTAVLPALALWRWVLVPVGRVLAVVARETGEALRHAWRIAGRISRAVGRVLAALLRWILVDPVRRLHRTVLVPAGHALHCGPPPRRRAWRGGPYGRHWPPPARPYGRPAPTSGGPCSASPARRLRWTGGNPRAAGHVLLRGVPPLSRRTRTLGKRQPEGPPPAPAVQRIRLRYTKRGRLRFTSHRDFQRAFERALRRAEVPMAYSAGFTPHPKVSYANAAPTGTGSEAEYLEIALTEARDPGTLRALLDESLPTGLDIVDAVEARTPGLADRLTASVWELRLDGVDPLDARRAVDAFTAAGTVEVQRMTKNGVRTFDARPAVAELETHSSRADGPTDQPCAILRLVVRHVTPAVRPDDVLSGLRAVADLAPPVPAAVTRLAQGLFDEETGTVTDPLAPDREAAEALTAAPAAAATAPTPEGSA